MNPIGNNVFINQQTSVVSSVVSGHLNSITSQSAIAFQIFADKQNLIRRAKKIAKSKSIDPELEHEKETQREYHFSTEEYEKIFMHENHLPKPSVEERIHHIHDDQIAQYQDVDKLVKHVKDKNV